MKKLIFALSVFVLLVMSVSVIGDNDKIEKLVEDGFKENNKVDVIIELKEGGFGINEAEKEKIKISQSNILNKLGNDFNKKYAYKTANVIAGKINKNALNKLKNDENVKAVYFDRVLSIELADSAGIIKSNTVNALRVDKVNVTGTGETVCILDTGVDTDHPAFGDRIVSEHCYCTISDKGSGGCCPDNTIEDTSAEDDHGHGTHVSGIVGASGSVRGVAPDVNIVALKVCNSTGSCSSSDINAGIDWCTTNKNSYNISVISMSIGGGTYINQSDCPNTFRSTVDAAYSSNIFLTAAAGNSGSTTGISEPACLANVTAVGAVDDNDNIASFSNRGILLRLVAQGSSIVSTAIGGGTTTMSGTSMATPHVAGAAALLIQYIKAENGTNLSQDTIKQVLNNTGKLVVANGLSLSRINVYYALINLDNEAPKVNISKPENKTYTNNLNLNLNYIVSDVNLASVWYNLDKGVNTSLLGNTTFNTNPGSHTLYLYANDSNNKVNSSNVTFFIDLINPLVSLNSPADNSVLSSNSVSFNCSASDYSKLMNINLWHNQTGNWVLNSTRSVSGTINESIFTVNGFAKKVNLTWNCVAADNSSLFDWGVNRSLEIRVNIPPNITSFFPTNLTPRINEAKLLSLNLSAKDGENNAISYSWYINNVLNVSTQNITYKPDYSSSGVKNITVFVKDSLGNNYKNWSVYVTNVIYCGNAIKETSEDCDGSDLNGKSCTSLGYTGGSLSCGSCVFVTSSCTNTSSSSGGSGGGSGGGEDIEEEIIEDEPAIEAVAAEESPAEEVPSVEVSEQSVDFSGGKQTITIAKGEKAKFVVGNEEHNLVIDEITNESVTLTLSSDPITFSLSLGESKSLDLDKDEVDDVIVSLERIDIETGKVDISFSNAIGGKGFSFTGLAIFNGRNVGIAVGALVIAGLIIFVRAVIVRKKKEDSGAGY